MIPNTSPSGLQSKTVKHYTAYNTFKIMSKTIGMNIEDSRNETFWTLSFPKIHIFLHSIFLTVKLTKNSYFLSKTIGRNFEDSRNDTFFSKNPDFFQTNSITFILIIPIAVTFKCSNQKSKKNEKKRLKDLTFDVLAECSSFFEWVWLSGFRVL